MAEHLRHELARSGFPLRPSRVGTLAQFLDAWGVAPAAPRSLLHILIEDALERLRPKRFERVREFRGLHAELAKLLEEAPSPEQCGGELAALFSDVETQLTERGFALRNARLRAAAEKLRTGEATPPAETIFDGFFTLAPAEVEFVLALARGNVTVTLPEADPRLVAAGFEVERLEGSRREPERVMFSAATSEREAEEIARRILEHASRGRRFREMGVILRSREPYGPLVETTLARFGIPARAYFTEPLASHPAVTYVAGVVRGLLEGWNHAAVNSLLRMPVSGVGATLDGDRFDFALRELLPGRGLPIPGLKEPPLALDAFQRITPWRRERLEPAEWAERLKELGRLVASTPFLAEELDRDQVHALRSVTAARARFEEVVEAAAGFASPGNVPLAEFWKLVETSLAVEPLRVEDRRREVVHVMDVYEARQWELPVVFVCGVLERVFPQYHGENPVLGDPARRKMGLATSAELQAEERFLFDLAVTRATAQVVLSHARFDDKGEETLPSFFLDGAVLDKAGAPAVEIRVRPKPSRGVSPAAPGPIQNQALLREASKRHRKLSATSIEKFLQCPFQFFANKTLRLRERPAAPRDRLDALAQGSIIHGALAEWWRAPLLGNGVLDQVFDMECARKRVPRTYRTEAVRLELLRHFESFLKDSKVELGWDVRVEEEFEFALNESLTIRGRIDRLEVGENLGALVVDYKYSTQVKGRVQETESGDLVQAGLYLLAAERAFGLNPVGMLFCGLKNGVEWVGWHTPVAGLERVGSSCTREALRELMDGAGQKAIETREAILAGRVEVRPKDRKKCDWCDYRDICRVETLPVELGAGAGG